MSVGDQTVYENWTKFDLRLEEGDVIRISVISTAEDTLGTGECEVAFVGSDHSYARAIAFYFAPPNNYVDCADNLVEP
jgi:hypothetical protein